MADNYLITGYWGEPHVTTENDRGFNAAVFGAGKFVLPVGEMFRAEYIGNNTVRVYDGKLINNGAVAGIPAGTYIDLLIPEAGQGMNRNDLVIFQYSQDTSTLVESGVFTVLSGAETNGTAVDPILTEEDLLTDKATFDQMALWRVPVSGANISDPVQLFDVSKNIRNAGSAVVEATSDDGVAYSATVPGVTELTPGLEVTIIPKVESTSTAITLDINGLGAKFVRLPLSTNTAILVQPTQASFFVDNRPVKLIYDDKYASKGSWVVVGRQRINGNDVYGSVPIECGGTGADNVEDAKKNLGILPVANNFTTTGEGYVADARTVKTLNGSKLEIKLLWQNASTSSNFASSTVTTPDVGHRFVVIEYKMSTSATTYAFTPFILANDMANPMDYFTNEGKLQRRRAYATATQVRFSAGQLGNSDDNSLMIPVRIYAVKGAIG